MPRISPQPSVPGRKPPSPWKRRLGALARWLSTRRGRWVLASLLAVLGGNHLAHRVMAPHLASEPDTFYVLAMAKLASQGVVRSVPAVEDLGWGQRFVDKNFLFTALTGLAYRWGGEAAVLGLVPWMTGMVLVALFLVALRFLPPPAAAAVVLVLLVDTQFAARLYKLRPHVGGMAAFCWALYGIVAARPRLAAVAVALFASAYHLFLIPLALVLGAAFANRHDRRVARRWALAAVGGTALGLVLNPYFPSHLGWAVRILQIATNAGGLSEAERPVENLPLTTDAFLARFGVYLCLVMGALIWRLRQPAGALPGRGRLSAFLVVAAAGLWAATAVAPRAHEYAIPVTAALFAVSLGGLARTREVALAALGLMVLGFGRDAATVYRHGFEKRFDPAFVTNAIDSIPKEIVGKKVFNCEWALSPYLFHRRPDLRFVDILDPSLLAEAAPTLHTLRGLLREGRVASPFAVIRQSFKADFVLCSEPAIRAQLETDPHFLRIYPHGVGSDELARSSVAALYVVSSSAFPNELTVFETAHVDDPRSTPAAPGLTWSELRLDSQIAAFRDSPYADFRLARHLARQPASGGVQCTAVRPRAADVRRLAGATVLGIGGGPNVRLWWNGKPLLQAAGWSDKPGTLRGFVELPRPLAATDSLEAIVCSQPEDTYEGFSLSLWTRPQLDELCRAKISGVSPSTDATWPVGPHRGRNCLGPYLAGG